MKWLGFGAPAALDAASIRLVADTQLTHLPGQLKTRDDMYGVASPMAVERDAGMARLLN